MTLSGTLYRHLWPLLPVRLRLRISGLVSRLQHEAQFRLPECDTEVFLYGESLRQFFPCAKKLSADSSQQVAASVIVTCKNEANSIERFLASIAEQTVPPAELVICDGGSTDGTAQLIEHWYKAHDVPWSLQLLVSPGANIAKGRNIAIAAAKEEILVCTDAGVVLEPEWYARMVAPFALQETVDVVAGWYQMRPKTSLHRGLERFIVPQLSAVSPRAVLPSARSVAFRRALWKMAGGFPEYLSFAGEDTGFALALRSVSQRWAFVPEAQVVWEPPLSRIFTMLKRYATGDGEAGIFSGYYLSLVSRTVPVCGDFLFAAALLMIASVTDVTVLYWSAAALFMWALAQGWAIIESYAPASGVSRLSKSYGERCYALLLLVTAQTLGVIRGWANRPAVTVARRKGLQRALCIEAPSPVVVNSPLFIDTVLPIIQQEQYVVIVYADEELNWPAVQHPRLEQWPRRIFDAECWQQQYPNLRLEPLASSV